MLGMCRVKDSYGIRKLGSEVFDPLVASRLQLSYEHAPVEEISVYYNARDPSVKPGVSNRCQPEETAPNTGIREHDVRPRGISIRSWSLLPTSVRICFWGYNG